MFQLRLAEHLHMGLSDLWHRMTPAETLIWQAYFDNQAEDRKIKEATG